MPYDDASALRTLDTLRGLMDLYVFQEFEGDRMKQWPFNPQMTHEPFPSDFAFQETLSDTFAQFMDGHLDYRVRCYRTFAFVQPLYVVAVVDGASTTRFVIYAVDKDTGLDSYVGYEIVKINGQDVRGVIMNYASSQYGKFRAARTRLTRATATRYFDSQAGTFKLDRGFFFKRTKVPDGDKVTYTVRHPDSSTTKDISVDWSVFFNENKPFSNQQDYYDAYCKSKNSEAPVAVQHVNGIDMMNGVDDGAVTAIAHPAVNFGTETQAFSQPVYKNPGEGFALYMFNGLSRNAPEKIGVLVIETFNPSIPYGQWLTSLRKGFRALQAQGVYKLILDLTNNPGGVICMAQSLIRLLDPSSDVTSDEAKAYQERLKKVEWSRDIIKRYGDSAFRQFPDLINDPDMSAFKTPAAYVSSIRKSNLVGVLAQAANALQKKDTPFVPGAFIDPMTLQPYTNATWGKSHEIKVALDAGLAQNALHYGPLLDYCPRAPEEVPTSHPFTGKNLMIMSNGACGSSCAIVAAFFQEKGTQSVYMANQVHAKSPNVPIFSFAGGQVLRSNYVLGLLKAANVQGAPQPFPMQTEFTLPYRSILSRNSKRTLPLEVVSIRPTQIVPITAKNALQPDRQWEAAAMAASLLDKDKETEMCERLRTIHNTIGKEEYEWRKAKSTKGSRLNELKNGKLESLGFKTIAEAHEICDVQGAIKLGPSLAPSNDAYLYTANRIFEGGDVIKEYTG